MVHNGIEYGDMQLICEAYWMLKNALGLSNPELYDVFAQWNRTELDSYLIEITRDIFSVKDELTGGDLVDLVVDAAGAKGTGKWMSQLALDLGVPSTLVTEAVYARCLSAMRDCAAAREPEASGSEGQAPRRPRRSSSSRSARPFTPRRFAATPRGSCSFRRRRPSTAGRWISARSPCSGAAAASSAPSSSNGSRKPSTPTRSWRTSSWRPTSKRPSPRRRTSWRNVVATAVRLGIPTPAFSAALAYFDGYRSERLPANLLQSQRDYFGAHTYNRIDREGVFHTDWLRSAEHPAIPRA